MSAGRQTGVPNRGQSRPGGARYARHPAAGTAPPDEPAIVTDCWSARPSGDAETAPAVAGLRAQGGLERQRHDRGVEGRWVNTMVLTGRSARPAGSEQR